MFCSRNSGNRSTGRIAALLQRTLQNGRQGPDEEIPGVRSPGHGGSILAWRPGAPQTSSFWGFMEASLRGHVDKPWLLVTDPTPATCPSPEAVGGTESSSLSYGCRGSPVRRPSKEEPADGVQGGVLSFAQVERIPVSHRRALKSSVTKTKEGRIQR